MKKSNPLKILFVADPLENFNYQNETTLMIMREAQKRGHAIFSTLPSQISATSEKLVAETHCLRISKQVRPDWYEIQKTGRHSLRDFDAVLLRKDPPFDLDYLYHLSLLERMTGLTYLMNHPRGILLANEKILPLEFPELIPETLISADEKLLMEFIQKHPKGTILKPLGSSGGRGVYFLRNAKVENLRVILEAASQNFQRYVILQEYLPVTQKGDKRILLLGQKVLGAFVRMPAKGEYRANLHSGGRAVHCSLTKRDQQIVEAVAPSLERLGLDFVGLDVIGDRLIEVNVTSPMGLAEINAVHATNSQVAVVDFIENKLKVRA